MNKLTTLLKFLITNLFALIFVCNLSTRAQNCSMMNLQWQSDITSVCSALTMTMIHDDINRPYLYVANKEYGLTIFDISNLTIPQLVTSIPISNYDSLEVMNLSQQGNYLFLALGNYFNPQKSGMAIVDISNPTLPFVTDYWEYASTAGAGIVKAFGNYAYLGGMYNGLFILDISDKTDIQLVSHFMPDISFPDLHPDTAKYNVRGLFVTNNVVYMCFDAGGIRVINVTNKSNPIETGRYSNPVMNSLPRAYNNIVVDDTLAYVAVDYCGMEILNIADTSDIKLVGWWNPYDCPNNNWFTSPVHANEIFLNKQCNQIFLSTGKSDFHVIDVSNPHAPDSCNYYGSATNGMGTWGMSSFGNQLFLSYICIPLSIPFYSNWTGVKILTYNSQCITDVDNLEGTFSISPNPAVDFISIKNNLKNMGNTEISIIDLTGKIILEKNNYLGNEINFDISEFTEGIYFLRIKCEEGIFTKKIIKILNHGNF